MNNAWRSLPHSPGRRALLVGAAAAPWWAGRAFAQADPEVAAYKAFVGARAVRTERLVLDIPRIADNGNLVPVRIAMPGPFAPGAEVKSIHLFSQKNPVAQMAVFHFPVPVGRVEVESRVRLAGTQRVAAVATLADGTLYAAMADVIVTVSACIDGT
jgi:sulfur-oxidizing protein SoxY